MNGENDKSDTDGFLGLNLTTLEELEELKKNNVDWKSLFAITSEEEFSSLLYILTHQKYEEEDAKELWFKILEHNDLLEDRLGRNPGLLVATLDYLWNYTDRLVAPYLTEEETIDYIKNKSVRDDLTDLCTRDVFNYCIDKEIANAKRYKTPLVLAVLDIDNFRKLNDSQGHNKGDRVLRDLAALIKSQMRESDFPIRYGGEEFAIVMRETQGLAAMETMERLRNKIAKTDLGDLRITVSIGLSEFNPDIHTSKSLFLESSDQAMYTAKRSGKNMVIFN